MSQKPKKKTNETSSEKTDKTAEPEHDVFEDPNKKEEQSTEGWERAGSIIWQPEMGDVLLGTYDGNEPFTEGTLEVEVSKHFVITATDRRYSFVGGTIFDTQIESAGIRPGYKIRVEFLGKKETKKEGRRVNIFDVRYRS